MTLLLGGAQLAGLAGVVIAVTAASAVVDEGEGPIYTAWGFRSSVASEQTFGSPATMGARSPTSYAGFTIEEIVRDDTAQVVFALDGNHTGGPPFSKLELFANGVPDVTLLRSAAAVPNGNYNPTNTCTYWQWFSGLPAAWPNVTSPTMRIS